jgi:hypothetical protein
MKPYQEAFEAVRARPAMYLQDETYAAACAFVHGYDTACVGGVLVGFREWLVVRVGAGSNLGWPALVLHACFPNVTDPLAGAKATAAAHRVAVDGLFGLIADFEQQRCRPDGLLKIYVAYEQFLHDRESA